MLFSNRCIFFFLAGFKALYGLRVGSCSLVNKFVMCSNSIRWSWLHNRLFNRGHEMGYSTEKSTFCRFRVVRMCTWTVFGKKAISEIFWPILRSVLKSMKISKFKFFLHLREISKNRTFTIFAKDGKLVHTLIYTILCWKVSFLNSEVEILFWEIGYLENGFVMCGSMHLRILKRM